MNCRSFLYSPSILMQDLLFNQVFNILTALFIFDFFFSYSCFSSCSKGFHINKFPGNIRFGRRYAFAVMPFQTNTYIFTMTNVVPIEIFGV